MQEYNYFIQQQEQAVRVTSWIFPSSLLYQEPKDKPRSVSHKVSIKHFLNLSPPFL